MVQVLVVCMSWCCHVRATPLWWRSTHSAHSHPTTTRSPEQKGVRVCNYANSGGVNKKAVGTCLAPGVSPPAGKAPNFEMVALPWPVTRSDPATAASKLLVSCMHRVQPLLALPPQTPTRALLRHTFSAHMTAHNRLNTTFAAGGPHPGPRGPEPRRPA